MSNFTARQEKKKNFNHTFHNTSKLFWHELTTVIFANEWSHIRPLQQTIKKSSIETDQYLSFHCFELKLRHHRFSFFFSFFFLLPQSHFRMFYDYLSCPGFIFCFFLMRKKSFLYILTIKFNFNFPWGLCLLGTICASNRTTYLLSLFAAFCTDWKFGKMYLRKTYQHWKNVLMRQNDFDNKDIKDNLQFCVILSSPRSTPVT